MHQLKYFLFLALFCSGVAFGEEQSLRLRNRTDTSEKRSGQPSLSFSPSMILAKKLVNEKQMVPSLYLGNVQQTGQGAGDRKSTESWDIGLVVPASKYEGWMLGFSFSSPIVAGGFMTREFLKDITVRDMEVYASVYDTQAGIPHSEPKLVQSDVHLGTLVSEKPFFEDSEKESFLLGAFDIETRSRFWQIIPAEGVSFDIEYVGGTNLTDQLINNYGVLTIHPSTRK